MTKKITLLLAFSIILPALFFGQGETSNWYFGNNAGIRFNNDFAQVISVVHITTGAGGLIVFTPIQPAIIPTPELLGVLKSRIQLRLLKNDLSPVDTRSTNWSARVRIRWKEARRLDVLNIEPHTHHS